MWVVRDCFFKTSKAETFLKTFFDRFAERAWLCLRDRESLSRRATYEQVFGVLSNAEECTYICVVAPNGVSKFRASSD